MAPDIHDSGSRIVPPAGSRVAELIDDVKRLIREVAEIKVQTATLADAFRQEVEGSRIYRRDMRDTVEEIQRRMSIVENLARVVQTEVAQLTPTVEGLNIASIERRGEVKGRKTTLALIWTTGLTVAAFLAWLVGELRGWWPHWFKGP